MYNMTGIAKFYNKFLSFIELDPTRPDSRVDPTRVQLWVAVYLGTHCNIGSMTAFPIGVLDR